jgi:hypothetical protein
MYSTWLFLLGYDYHDIKTATLGNILALSSIETIYPIVVQTAFFVS